MESRVLPLAALFTLLIALFITRLFHLQVVRGEELATAVQESRVETEQLPALRGRILDRHGVAIADNRAVYHLAAVLGDLELDWREARQVPYLRLDEQGFDAFIADLSLRLPKTTHAALREAVLKEMLGHPAVAVRSGARVDRHPLEVILVPRALFAVGDDDDGTTALAESDLLCEDPRKAVEREIVERWKDNAELFTPAEFTAAAEAIGRDSNIGADRCSSVLEAFAPLISLDVAAEGTPAFQWRVLTDDGREQAETALSRFLGVAPQVVAHRLRDALVRREASPVASFYFAASISAQQVEALLPKGQTCARAALGGVPDSHERHLIIQCDWPEGSDTPGLFTQLQNRIAANLNAPGDWVGALIERHAEKMRAVSCERIYHLHQLAFDAAKLDHLCSRLPSLLTASGIACTRLDIEQQVALARRVADKEWRGQTRHDPIAIVRDVPQRIALMLDGKNAVAPKDLAAQYDGAETVLPGLGIQLDVGREYPFPGCASHLIGTVGRVSASLDRETAQALGLDPSGWQGSTGLEKTYDERMRGIPGSRVRLRSETGSRLIREEAPIGGEDVVTELDLELQLSAEDCLAHWLDLAKAMGTATAEMEQAQKVGQGRAGMAVIDCRTGGILALASSPGYRLDEMRRHYRELDDKQLSPGQPLHDHAAEAEQPPGSAVKILTALCALDYQLVKPNEEYVSQGFMAKVAGKQVLRSHAGPGTYDLVKAIQVSDNCYFAHLGERIGGERLAAYFDLFGIGHNNALDVAEQWPGRLPTPATLPRFRPSEPKWMVSDSWRLAIGQFLTASPLQVVTIAAAVANGGHVVTPYVVKPAGGSVVKELGVRKDYLDVVRRGMELVTENRDGSTAKYLILEGKAAGIKVAAKTGTSEWGSSDSRKAGLTPDHSWLIGYAPAENPVIAFAIFIHSGTSGGRACSPVAKKVLEGYFARYGRAGHGVVK